MRIAFLNPWKSAPENQAFPSIRVAAERIGHDLVHCANSAEIEEAAPDFVLATASTQAKLNDVPTYGVIHEPRDRFLSNRRCFHNLLTYDGYLTVSDRLERFLRDILYGAGRTTEIGFYANTCHRQERVVDLDTLVTAGRLRITYCGTNWDKRRPGMFKRLSDADGVDIYGPTHAWTEINPRSYKGPLPFDGESVQTKYRENGIGLCLLSDQSFRDDVSSNRVFEVTSVGAIAICADIPWIRRHFGDSVYYIDQGLADTALARAILQRREEIYRNPSEAATKARRARAIFEERFAADLLLGNAVAYHQRLSARRDKAVARARATYSPLVSVVVRCGSRPPAVVRRVVESLSRQTYGQFEVVFVRHGPVDLTAFTERTWPRLAAIQVVECAGGDRSASLWAGLAALGGEYFAIVDDDDWLFSNHFETLFAPWPSAPQTKFLAYSGTIACHAEPRVIDGGGVDRRELHTFGIESSPELVVVSRAFASNCFVASRDLLHPALLQDPQMATAEDSFLILSLLAQATPRFSYAATSAHERGQPDRSNFLGHPDRFEDQLTLRSRLFGAYRPAFAGDGWEYLSSYWKQHVLHVPEVVETEDRVIHRARGFTLPLPQGDEPECLSRGYDPTASVCRPPSRMVDPETGAAEVRPPDPPGTYGALFALRPPSTGDVEYVLIVELQVLRGTIGVGLLNVEETDFLFYRSLVESGKVYVLQIPIADVRTSGRLAVKHGRLPGPSWANLLSVRLCHASGSISSPAPGFLEGAPPRSGSALSPEAAVELEHARQARDQARREAEQVRREAEQVRREAEQVRRETKTAQDRVAAMESSKFWKLRRVWFRAKRAVGRGDNE